MRIAVLSDTHERYSAEVTEQLKGADGYFSSMHKWKLTRVAWLGLSLVCAQSVMVAEVPVNLSTAKKAVLRYVDSGEYKKDLTVTADQASGWIETRAAQSVDGEQLALVLDIDETVLSNLPHMREMDFGYLPKLWDEWVAEGSAPAIEAARQVYETARSHEVTVFFITGRKESDRLGTVKNLAAMGMGEYEQLICKPLGFKSTSGDYKTRARQRLEAEGWTIIANVGDQHSDLQGGYSEKIFKLVNPFYLID